MSARVWGMAGIVSVLLHGAGLAAIALSTKPAEPPDQKLPKSQFSIEAAEVPRSRAAPQTPQAVTAAQSDAPSIAAQGGAVPLSRARPVAARVQKVAAAPVVASVLGPGNTKGVIPAPVTGRANQVLASAARPAPMAAVAPAANPIPSTATEMTALKPSAAAASLQVAAVKPAPAALSAAQPVLAPAVPALTATAQRPAADVPAPAPLALAAPNAKIARPEVPVGDRAIPATPVAAPAPTAAPEAIQSGALPLPALAGKATLGWSGEEDAAVSATSLAAIAAFTQAGDLQAASAQIRDGIEGILASVPCARLQTTFLPDTGQLELRGHIPADGLRGPVLAALQEQVGEAIELSDQLLILPRPQCGALSGIAAVGLPQSTEQLTDPAVIGEDGFARTYTYVDGERLRLDLTAPDYDSYIYMDYFVADGSVIHLQPNEIVPLEFAPAKSAQSVGRARDGKPFLELTVSPPFGQEIAAAFATSVPLYDEPRPIQEPAETYLAFLKERVAAARAAHPDFKGEWVYFFITTEAG